MNKINKYLVILLAPVFMFCFTGCPAPSGGRCASSTWMDNNTDVQKNLQSTTLMPTVSIKVWASCPNTRMTITYSNDFGAVKTLEIYQAIKMEPFVKIATFTGLTGTVTYYDIRLASGAYRFYVKALRSKDNVWYSSGTFHYSIYCSSSSSSASSGVY